MIRRGLSLTNSASVSNMGFKCSVRSVLVIAPLPVIKSTVCLEQSRAIKNRLVHMKHLFCLLIRLAYVVYDLPVCDSSK